MGRSGLSMRHTSSWHYAQKCFPTALKDRSCIIKTKETAFPEKTFETRQSGQVRTEWAMRPDQTRCGSLVSVVKKARKNGEVRCPEQILTPRSLEGIGVGGK